MASTATVPSTWRESRTCSSCAPSSREGRRLRRTNISTRHIIRRRSPGSDRRPSLPLDRAVDGVPEPGLLDGEHHLGRQRFAALQPAILYCLAHGLFDLALGRHADDLEELAQRGVESLFVHGGLLAKLSPARDHKAAVTPIKDAPSTHNGRMAPFALFWFVP